MNQSDLFCVRDKVTKINEHGLVCIIDHQGDG